MNFDSLRKCYTERWSSQKINKWNEWNRQFSDDEVVFIGAKVKAENKTSLYPVFYLPLGAFAICGFSAKNILLFIPLVLGLILIPLSTKIVIDSYKQKGLEDYTFRKELFKIGIEELKTEFHNEGVRKHQSIMQKKYEESRRKEGK